jgi:hypothetical protein
VQTLADFPAEAADLIKARLQATARVKDDVIAAKISDLDSPTHAVRQKAEDDLKKLGDQVEAQVKKALTADPSPEAEKRLGAILKALDGHVPTGDDLRAIRAMETLEFAALPASRTLLQHYAKMPGSARMTREARESLQRLSGRDVELVDPRK